ncbi:MAG: efflux RND transporter periplasmic adaptor subunit [Sedimenticola sp.]
MKKASLLSCLLLLPALLPAADAPAPTQVVVAAVEEREITETSRLVGVIDFDRISEVSGEISGLITEQRAIEGALVRQGEALVTLNTDLLRKDMDIKRRERAQVSADLEKTGRTVKRLESLLKKNSASRQAYDDARFDYRALQQKSETLEQELQRLTLQIEKSTVRAPFTGIVLEKMKEQGEWLAPGSPVCRLASTDGVIAKIALSEKLVRYQQPGDKVALTVSALGLQTKGAIAGFVPELDLRSKSALLKIALPYQPGMLQNMSVVAEVSSSDKRMLRLVPRDALVRMKGKDHVYIVEENSARLQPITIVARNTDSLGVADPQISAGMTVIVDGNDRLRPGQSVSVTNR